MSEKKSFYFLPDVSVKNMDNPSTARPPILNTMRK